MMILLLNRYSHLPIVPDFLFMVVSRYQYDVASSTGGLAFVLVSFVQVASSFACAVHVFAIPFVGSKKRGIGSCS